MMKKKLEWIKRGICITLAGAMIICSDTTAFAADLSQHAQASLESDGTETNGGQTVDRASGQQEPTEVQQVSEEQETTENTQTSETTENTEATEKTEVTETSEITEATETTESGTEEAQRESNIKGSKPVDIIRVTGEHKYKVVSIGEDVVLPGYTILYTDGTTDTTGAEWVSDDMGIVQFDAGKTSVKALTPGVALLKIQVPGQSKSGEFRVIVKPQAPVSASLQSSTYDSAVLSWSKVAESDGYVISRKSEKDSDYTEIGKVAGNSNVTYEDRNGLVTGVKYAYHINPYIEYKDDSGVTQYAQSDTPAVISMTPVLGQVTATGAVANGCDSATVTWNLLPGANGYTIYRAAGSSNDFTEVGGAAETAASYTDQSLTAGTSYKYKVKAYRIVNNNKVYGDFSNVVTVTPVPQTSVLSLTSYDYKSVKLGWTQSGGAQGYVIERRKASESSFKKIATVGSGTKVSYVDKKVATGTKYVYRVRAYRVVNDKKVWSEYSNQLSATPTLQAPSVTVGNASYNSLSISWNKVAGADGYRILRSESLNGKYKTVKTSKSESVFTYTDKGLSVGQTYYYKVRAYRSVNGKNLNGTASTAGSGIAVPSAPKVGCEAAGATAVKLTWSKVDLPSGKGGYFIYQVVNGTEQRIKSCGSKATSYTVKNLTCGENYTFKVVAYAKNASGSKVQGAFSEAFTTTPQLLPVTIDTVEASNYNSVKVSWKASAAADEDFYLVYRATSKKGRYQEVGTVAFTGAAAAYSYEDANVTIGKRYFYKVSSCKTLPSGAVVKAKMSAAKSVVAAPGPTTVKLKASKSSSIKVTWRKVRASQASYVDGYAIYRSESENGKYKKVKTIANGTTTSYMDKGLVTGNTYYYKVRTYCVSGGKNIYGPYSPVASKRVVPGAPSITAASTSYDTVTVSWKKVTDSQGYVIYRSDSQTGKYARIKTVSGDKLSFANSGLKTGNTYYYKVRAFVKKDNKKIYGAFSGIQYAVPTLGKPTGLAASAVDNGQIKVTWTAVPGAKSYTVLRSTKETGKYKIATEICSTNSYIDANAKVGATYYYKVYAVRGSFKSEVSDCITAISASLELNVTSVTIKTGTNIKVTAKAKPATQIYWTSENSTIAIVTSEGVIYGLKAGTTNINASANGVTKKIAVTVKDKLENENKGIEISSTNGNVDFNAIRAAGYDYVMLRACYGTTEDSNFKKNLKNAKAAGLKVGVYCYAYAQNVNDAKNEADKVIGLLNGQTIDYPVVYMMDDERLLYNSLSKEQRDELVYKFRDELATAGKGYKFTLGISMTLMAKYPTKYLDTSKFAGMDIMVLNNRAENLGHGYFGTGNVAMWRYTQTGSVNGVSGNANIIIRYKTY